MRWHTEKIDFSSGTLQLHAMIYLPKGEGRFPGAVMCHGVASDHRSMRPSAQQLARRGCVALTLDLRGHGKSDGTLDSDIGRDVIAAVEILRNHAKVNGERIALVGHSMGAVASLYAATVADDIKALVLLSLPAEMDGFMGFWSPMYAKAERIGTTILEFPRLGPLPFIGWLNKLTFRFWMWIRGYKMRIDIRQDTESWAALNSSDNIAKINDTPKLFMHCKGDKWLPYEKTVELYEKAKIPKEMVLLEGGFHVTPLLPGKPRESWISW
ncbi:MAG: alpha/beta fold hydrolase, partial [Chloroflexota bacterium]|nr:alpha/beta fold hydrolase [Chloroflexota bacterium]